MLRHRMPWRHLISLGLESTEETSLKLLMIEKLVGKLSDDQAAS
jgi:hypothetical protein